MFRGGASILDDRGRKVPVFDLMDRSVLNASGMRDDPELAEAVMRANEAMVQGEAFNRDLTKRDVLNLLVVSLTIPAAALVTSLVWPGAPGWAMFIIVVPVLGISSVWYARRRHQEIAGRLANTLLAYGRCASCGYSMAGVIAGSDGALLCPECGAAWRADRVATLRRAPEVTAGAMVAGEPPRMPWSYRSMWNRSASVMDARGRAVALMDPARLRDELPAKVGAARVAAVRRAIARETRGAKFGIGCFGTAVLLGWG